MLRVVQDGANFDALNELADFAKATESIHVYTMVGEPVRAMVDGVRNGKRAGWCASFAKYRHWPEEIPDATLRDNDRWAEWCEANKDMILESRKVNHE